MDECKVRYVREGRQLAKVVADMFFMPHSYRVALSGATDQTILDPGQYTTLSRFTTTRINCLNTC